MTVFEYKNLLNEQIEILKNAQMDALDREFYSDVAELNKQINFTALRILQCGIEVRKNEPN